MVGISAWSFPTPARRLRGSFLQLFLKLVLALFHQLAERPTTTPKDDKTTCDSFNCYDCIRI